MSRAATPPPPREFAIVRGRQRAWIREGGAALRQYAVDERQLLDGFGRWDWSEDGRGQLLMPWPNRIRAGRYTLAGRTNQLPLSEPERGNAIHGLARWAAWRELALSASELALAFEVEPQPGYPHRLELTARYRLTESGLEVTLGATNLGRTAAPFGAGAHPYLRLGEGPIDELELQLPGSSRLEADPGGIPTGRSLAVDGTEFDFRHGRRLGPESLDTCFTDLGPGEGWRATIGAPRLGGLEIWGEGCFRYLMVYTGDSVGDPARRRRGLALEPMTCAPDAFNNGLGLLVLEPGASFFGRWGLRWLPGPWPGAAAAV